MYDGKDIWSESKHELRRLLTTRWILKASLPSSLAPYTTERTTWFKDRHRRVIADDVVGPAFSHPQHVERLAAYWAEALGGPSTYSDSYGNETAVVKNAQRQRRARRNGSLCDCLL